MAKVSAAVPELRFKEFGGQWEPSEIRSLIVKTSKKVQLKEDIEYREIGVRSHGRGIFHKEPTTAGVIGSKRVFWVHPRAFVVNIVFAWEQAIALTSEREKGMIASHRFPMWIPRDGKVNLEFLRYFFRRKRGKYLLELASPGGAGRNKTLGQEDFGKLKVVFPKIEEQEKIAASLGSVDEKIALLEKKRELFEQYKKGVMQQIFSQQIRFKDDNGNDFPDWEEKRLGEIALNSKYGMNAAAVPFDGKAKYLRITDIDEESRSYLCDPPVSPKGGGDEDYRLVEGDIVFTRTGASVGKSYLYSKKDGPLYFAGFLIRFRIKDAEPEFIFAQTLRDVYRNWVRVMSVRSGQPGINAGEYERLPIVLPCKDEQRKIADFLTAIDDKIKLVAQQITHMRDFKKGLLQQMFV